MTEPTQTLPPVRRTLVDAATRTKPHTVDLLNDWQYLERSVHRILAGWGRRLPGWDDKSALHRQVWEQSEVVRRLRERVREFPGGKPDAPVSAGLEAIASIERRERLESNHLFHAVAGELYWKLGDNAAAAASYRRALQLAHVGPEQAHLARMLERTLEG